MKFLSKIKKIFSFLFRKAEDLEPAANAAAKAYPGINDDIAVKGGYMGLRIVKRLFKKKNKGELKDADKK